MLKTRYIVEKIRFYIFKKFRLSKNLKLANKLNLILIFFLIIISISNVCLSSLLQQRVQQEVTYKQLDAISEMISVTRNIPYELGTFNTDFIDITTIDKIFENFRKNVDYKNYRYLDYILDPNNLQNNRFPTQMVKQFVEGSANTYSDFHTFSDSEGKSFYIARCVKSQNNSFKNNRCFQYENKTISVQIVYIPTSKISTATRQFWLLTVIMPLAISAIVMIIIYLLLERIIIKPIAQISKDARLVSTGKADVDFEQRSKDEKRSKDEIVSLAASFNRMKSSLEISEMLRKQEKGNNSNFR